jgi:hypothetical protein
VVIPAADGPGAPGKKMSKRIAVIVLSVLMPFGIALPDQFYVSRQGNNAWSGRFAAPDGKGDGPFATLRRARDEIRRLRREKKCTGPVTVNVRAGEYRLEEPFVLTAGDSGEEDAPAVWRGYRDERPVLSGGREVTGFARFRNGILRADLAAQGWKDVEFRQLFFNGLRQIPARYPNFIVGDPLAGGWAAVDGETVDRTRNRADDSKRLLVARVGDARSWARPADGEVVIFPRFNWINDIVRIRSVDRKNRLIVLADDCSYAIRPGDRYFVQGFLEELDAPGEWFVDRTVRCLYFRPPAPLKDGAVVVPVLRTLVELSGASHVTFRGFTIECCEGSGVVLNRATD